MSHRVDMNFLRNNLKDSLSILRGELVNIMKGIFALTKTQRVLYPDFVPYENVDILLAAILDSREYITLLDFILERYFSLVKVFVEDIYYDVKVLKSLLFITAMRLIYYKPLKTYGIYFEINKFAQILQILIEVVDVVSKLVEEKIFDIVLSDKVRILIDEKTLERIANIIRPTRSKHLGRVSNTNLDESEKENGEDIPEIVFANTSLGMQLKEIYSIEKLPAIIFDGISIQGVNLFDPESVRRIISSSTNEAILDSIKEYKSKVSDIYDNLLSNFVEFFQTGYINKKELKNILLDMRIKIPLATKNLVLYYPNFSRHRPCFFTHYPVLMETVNYFLENLVGLARENFPMYKLLLLLFGLQDLKALSDSVLIGCSDTFKSQDTIVFVGFTKCPCCQKYLPLFKSYANSSSFKLEILDVEPDVYLDETSIRAADYYYTFIPNYGGTRDVPMVLWTTRVYYPYCVPKPTRSGEVDLAPAEDIRTILKKLLKGYFDEILSPRIPMSARASLLEARRMGPPGLSNLPSAMPQTFPAPNVNMLDPAEQAIELAKKGFNTQLIASILSRMYNTNITPSQVYNWIRSRGYKVRELRKYAKENPESSSR